jgi:hypothetical protein
MISIKSLVVHNENNNIIFGEENLTVTLEDDAAGYYIILSDGNGSEIKIDFKEVNELFKAINMLKTQIEKVK